MENPKDLLYEFWGCSLDDYLDAIAEGEEFMLIEQDVKKPRRKKDNSAKPKGKK